MKILFIHDRRSTFSSPLIPLDGTNIKNIFFLLIVNLTIISYPDNKDYKLVVGKYRCDCLVIV